MQKMTNANLQQCAAKECQAVQVHDNNLCGAAPKQQALDKLAASGLKTMVDFRPANEWSCPDWDQQVAATGMDYRHFPVIAVADLTPDITATVWDLWQDRP